MVVSANMLTHDHKTNCLMVSQRHLRCYETNPLWKVNERNIELWCTTGIPGKRYSYDPMLMLFHSLLCPPLIMNKGGVSINLVLEVMCSNTFQGQTRLERSELRWKRVFQPRLFCSLQVFPSKLSKQSYLQL